MKALRSKKYLAGSKGATCKFRIPGVCCGDTETVVPCHIHDQHSGRGIRASDISVADGCWRCHDVFDGRAKMPDGKLISDDLWHFYALRALQETLEARIEAKLLGFPHDPPPKAKKAKPKKPDAPRAKIHNGPTKWPSRAIPSRPMRRS